MPTFICTLKADRAGETLGKSRESLECICGRRHYDLILTIQTGCLLAARLSASHRAYVNPDWGRGNGWKSILARRMYC